MMKMCITLQRTTQSLKIDGKSSFNQYVEKNKLFERLQEYKDNNNIKTIAVVGELCGAGIQKNRLKLVQPQWYIFTIEVDGKRIGLAEMKKIADAIGNPTVPIEEVGYNFDEKYPTEEAIFDRAYGNYPNGGLKGYCCQTYDTCLFTNVT